jgi:putative ABC transport system substrate-binding protein
MPFDWLKRREFITLLGSATAWPVLARGQPSAIPVIGFLSPRSPEAAVQVKEAFRQGLREAGFIEGEKFPLNTGSQPAALIC